MDTNPPTFSKDFEIVNINGIKYYSYLINGYEITIEMELWSKFTVALYLNEGLQVPKITSLQSKEAVQEAINKMFLQIPNQ